MARAQQSRQPTGPPPPNEDLSDSTIDEMYPPRFLRPALDFNEKPTIVRIRSVIKEWVWSRFTGKWEEVKVMYFEGYHPRGLKLPKEQAEVVGQIFSSPKSKDWMGKKVKVVHGNETIAGKVHYLTRIAAERVPQDNELPQQQQQPAAPPPMITEEQLEELEGFGTQLYGDEWNEKSIELAEAVSKPSGKMVSDITELTQEQAQKLINGIISKINTEASEDEMPAIMGEVAQIIEENRNTPDDDDEDHLPQLGLDEEDEDFQEVYNGK